MPKVKTERRTAEPQLPLQHEAFSGETLSSGFRVKTEESDGLQLASRHALPPAATVSLKSGQASSNLAHVKNEVSDGQDLKPARRRTHHQWRAAADGLQLASRHALPPAATVSLKSGQASSNLAHVKNEVSDGQDLKPARRRTHHQWRAAATSVKRAADSDEYDSEAESVQSESTPNGEISTKRSNILKSRSWVADRVVNVLAGIGFKSALVGDMANALFGINDRSPKNIIIAVYSSNKSVKLPTKALRRRLAEADPT
ncbi:hypothetical protein CVT24_007208, partial [Panaeolus cyanescens]